jgi:ATP citrate (pro-S)-lyase
MRAGPVDTFLLEPFVPHALEYYASIQSVRSGLDLAFSTDGGVEIEANWEAGLVKTVHLGAGAPATGDALAPLLASVPLEARPPLEAFLLGVLAVFEDLDASFLEFNPLTVVGGAGSPPLPLDMRLELDDTAAFRSAAKWGDLEFPRPFGQQLSGAEAAVHALDAATGASLKLTILNPSGRVWLMVAGGGASVIFSDTVADLGFGPELGNYGEYSGAPNASETYLYARTVLEAATAGADGRPRALLIGGGIANFTDVAATFKGIIQAIREKVAALRAARMRIFVRRGGPNYEAGLSAMRALGSELGLSIDVFGPEASMTGICKLAVEHVGGGGAAAAAP